MDRALKLIEIAKSYKENDPDKIEAIFIQMVEAGESAKFIEITLLQMIVDGLKYGNWTA